MLQATILQKTLANILTEKADDAYLLSKMYALSKACLRFRDVKRFFLIESKFMANTFLLKLEPTIT